ncbi:UNVERIFIED_CONTAM: hypothetical protein Slati_0406600 [Sesamum latifolium]|uniref:Uncharacterized protein n=1 Tax=Sesamum latifolium TaxID=2727402 RepID=A0AAW2XV03_9LAMI
MEDHQPQPTIEDHDTSAESEASVAMTEQQLWLATIEGKNKGRVFGIGCETHISSRNYTSPSPPPQPNPAMEDRMVRMETMMVDMKAMMREMQASSSTGGLSQATTLTSGPAQPSTDPPASNEDDMNVVDEEDLD